MTPTIILTLFSSALAVSAAIFASSATYRGSAGHLLRRLEKLQRSFDELSDTAKLQDQAILNLRARVGMIATRAKRADSASASASSPESSLAPASDDEKARARRELGAKLANGSIKPLGR